MKMLVKIGLPELMSATGPAEGEADGDDDGTGVGDSADDVAGGADEDSGEDDVQPLTTDNSNAPGSSKFAILIGIPLCFS